MQNQSGAISNGQRGVWRCVLSNCRTCLRIDKDPLAGLLSIMHLTNVIQIRALLPETALFALRAETALPTRQHSALHMQMSGSTKPVSCAPSSTIEFAFLLRFINGAHAHLKLNIFVRYRCAVKTRLYTSLLWF